MSLLNDADILTDDERKEKVIKECIHTHQVLICYSMY